MRVKNHESTGISENTMKDDILSVSAQELYDEFGKGSIEDYDKVRANAEELRTEVEENVDYITAWHKTSHRLKDNIEAEGLLPRGESGMVSRDFDSREELNPESLKDRVYFTVKEGGIFPHADSATVNVIGGRRMQVKAYLDPEMLAPDEDSAADDYMRSLLVHGTFAHQGPIAPEKGYRSWIEEIDVGEELNIPDHVGQYLLRKVERDKREDEQFQNQVEKIKQSYDSQLTPAEARWLMEYNGKRQEMNDQIPRPTAMTPEPEQSLEEMIEELEDEE